MFELSRSLNAVAWLGVASVTDEPRNAMPVNLRSKSLRAAGQPHATRSMAASEPTQQPLSEDENASLHRTSLLCEAAGKVPDADPGTCTTRSAAVAAARLTPAAGALQLSAVAVVVPRRRLVPDPRRRGDAWTCVRRTSTAR